MSITFISAKKALNSAFFKLPVLESEIQKLSKNLEIYINSAKDGEYEEYHKGLIKDFFCKYMVFAKLFSKHKWPGRFSHF